MPELSLEELKTTAAAYEERLVPALFQQWTEPMADAAHIRAGQRVLDVACGTGVLARAVADRVGPGGSVTGLDVNPGMLAVAAHAAPGIEWRQGVAEELPFEDRTFDAVVSQFGLMFFPDREAALREMVRVLKPGGRLAVAVFDGLDRIPAYALMVDVLERVVGQEAANALRSPFVLGDTEALSSLFAAAGIPSAAIATTEGTERFPSVRDMVLGDVKGWFPLAGIRLDEDMIAALVAQAEAALMQFVTAGGAVEFPVRVHIVTAQRA
ncbi:MAG: class I SAM-dependent methyltransferase [Alphaproteobacteria bacterium]|nr:class I SAM-dependent methyltransferase [Alphaproteobacteria bacterium]